MSDQRQVQNLYAGLNVAPMSSLIDAAPDLLAALKTLLSFDAVTCAQDEGPTNEGWKSDELIAAFTRADEAIARAEGR